MEVNTAVKNGGGSMTSFETFGANHVKKCSIRRSDGKPFDLPIGTFGHVLGKLHARFYNREVKNLHHQRFKFHM
jgi:hypothetical protein